MVGGRGRTELLSVGLFSYLITLRLFFVGVSFYFFRTREMRSSKHTVRYDGECPETFCFSVVR